MDTPSLGKLISQTRKAQQMNQNTLASLVKKEDGESITPQYLNDIEHDRRTPSADLIRQFAQVLGLNAEYLDYLAGRIPRDWDENLSEETFLNYSKAFRKR